MSATRYKITITEITVETEIEGREWAKVDGNPDTRYDYTPEIEKRVKVIREIYCQNTDELDLKAVIKAINGL